MIRAMKEQSGRMILGRLVGFCSQSTRCARPRRLRQSIPIWGREHGHGSMLGRRNAWTLVGRLALRFGSHIAAGVLELARFSHTKSANAARISGVRLTSQR